MKYSRLLVPALLLALAPAAARAQRGSVFGVYDPDSFVSGNATRFMGCHDGRQFLAGNCMTIADTLARGDVLPAVDSTGRYGSVRLDAVHPMHGDLYEGPYTVSAFAQTGPAPGAPVMFWQPGQSLQVLEPRSVPLDSAALSILSAEAMRLYQGAEALRVDGDRSEGLVLGTPRALAVEGEDRVAVYWPADLTYGAERDTRASVFFIYHPPSRRVIHGVFGHPEWAPVEPEAVREVRPVLFFRFGRDRNVYILGRENGPWENIGFAIFDLRTGEAVLRSR